MENLPIDVIQCILTRVEAARDVVMVCVTSRSWQQAFRTHHSLHFIYDNWAGYRSLHPHQLEMYIDQAVRQTVGLRSLSIVMDANHAGFTADSVTSWLSHTRETLRHLLYGVRTAYADIMRDCNSKKLELLFVAYHSPKITSITGIFERLHTLSLACLTISAIDLAGLVMACPVLKNLSLISLQVTGSDYASLAIPTVHSLHIELMKFNLELKMVGNLENLYFKSSFIENVGVFGTNHLRKVDIEDCTGLLFINDIAYSASKFAYICSAYDILLDDGLGMLCVSGGLTSFRIWDVKFSDDIVYPLETFDEMIPQLRHLSLRCRLNNEWVDAFSQQCPYFKNLMELELGWINMDYVFTSWVRLLVGRCLKLEKLVIIGKLSDRPMSAEYVDYLKSSIFQMSGRCHLHVEVRFE
ncbi:F-box/LRR-repeat protein At1g67190-like [Magnolia sinica]|uniref:F-box/LRR-repeat protein At1g67190-like n=1 Tax=Magnolia sinica TaxID=86752 RepID=UPI0026597F41|nr:F-box/LRR-repeat protein At1g67190-like [Magnolia sinica]